MSQAGEITGIVMPKWGLSMTEGTIVEWLVAEGEAVSAGDLVAEVETDKINGEVEAVEGGIVRRIVTDAGSTLPVQALLAVLADPSVDDAAVDAFVAGFPKPPEPDEEETETSPYDTVELDGLQIRYSRLGEGPTAVLVHGFGGDLDNWLFNLTALAEVATVIALDLPGHGESSLSIPDPSADGLARFVWSVVDELGLDDIALIGHSLGGAVAARMAGQQPDRVRALGLLAPAGLGDEVNQGYIDGFVSARSRREMKRVATTLFADPSAVTRSMVDNLLRYKRLDGVGDLLTRLSASWFANGSQTESVADDLRSWTRPMAVVWGAEDQVIPASHADTVPEGAEVHVMPDAGHMVQMERAGEVNRILQALITLG